MSTIYCMSRKKIMSRKKTKQKISILIIWVLPPFHEVNGINTGVTFQTEDLSPNQCAEDSEKLDTQANNDYDVYS